MTACDHSKRRVLDSRPNYRDGVIRRRRECVARKARLTTFEITHEEWDRLQFQAVQLAKLRALVLGELKHGSAS